MGVQPEGCLEAPVMSLTVSRTVFISNQTTCFHLVLVDSNTFKLHPKEASAVLTNPCIFCSLSFTRDLEMYVYMYFHADVPSQEVHLLLSWLTLLDTAACWLTQKYKQKKTRSCLYNIIRCQMQLLSDLFLNDSNDIFSRSTYFSLLSHIYS